MQRLVMQSRNTEGTGDEGRSRFSTLAARGTNRKAAALVSTSNDPWQGTETRPSHIEKTAVNHESGLSLMLRQTLAVRKAGEQPCWF